jgi:hypothetical protein
VVRDVYPRADGLSGRAFEIIDYAPTAQPSNVTLRGVVVERSHSQGLITVGSHVTVENSVVRDTQPQAATQRFGRGISMEPDPTSFLPSSLTVRSSLCERNHEHGVIATFGDLVVERTWIRDTYPRPLDLLGGRGIEVHDDPMGVATLAATAVLVERSVGTGVFLASSSMLDGVVVRHTAAEPPTGLFGDGIDVIFIPAVAGAPPHVFMGASRIEANTRAGLAVYDATAEVGASALQCNAFDLDADPTALTDLGGNTCGCGDATEPCRVATSDLAPPSPL